MKRERASETVVEHPVYGMWSRGLHFLELSRSRPVSLDAKRRKSQQNGKNEMYRQRHMHAHKRKISKMHENKSRHYAEMPLSDSCLVLFYWIGLLFLFNAPCSQDGANFNFLIAHSGCTGPAKKLQLSDKLDKNCSRKCGKLEVAEE